MKPAQVAQLVLVAIAAVAVYSFARTARDAENRRVCAPLCALSPNYAARNRKAPDFDLPSLNGDRVRLSDLRGKVIILNFWTKTCRPCLEEMPSIAELGRMLKTHKGIEIVTLCTDETADDARATLQSVLGTKEPPFRVLMDPDAKVVRGSYGTKLYPETWFIDVNGVVRARIDGPRKWNEPLTVGFAETLKDPLPCDIEFRAARPVGRQAKLCGDD